MLDFLNTFAARLKPDPDTADGADWALAEVTLPEHITKPIPSCMFRRTEVPNPDYDELEEDSAKQKRTPKTIEAPIAVMEVVNVLAWVMAHKVNPVITLEEVSRGIIRENRRDMINDIWKFWTGVYLYTDEEEEVVADDSVNPPRKKVSPAKSNGKTSKA